MFLSETGTAVGWSLFGVLLFLIVLGIVLAIVFRSPRVTYVSNDGNVATTVKYKRGVTVFPPKLTRLGYRFDGWFNDREFESPAPETFVAKGRAHTALYAKWVRRAENESSVERGEPCSKD